MDQEQLKNLIALARSEKTIVREGAYAALLTLLQTVMERVGRGFPSVDADDVSSAGGEALMVLVPSYDTTKGPVTAAFAGILRRKCIDLLRAQRLQRRGGGQQAASLDDVVTIIDPSDELADVDTQDEARNAWATISPALTPIERKVFKARARGQTYVEIAATLGITAKVVDHTLDHARQKIARVLQSGGS